MAKCIGGSGWTCPRSRSRTTPRREAPARRFLIIPYLVLIVAAMFLQYYQMKQMNSRNPQAAAANPQMQTMQKFFPIIFGVIYLRVPAGATIYMVVSSAMRIGTQEVMFRSGYGGTGRRPSGRSARRRSRKRWKRRNRRRRNRSPGGAPLEDRPSPRPPTARRWPRAPCRRPRPVRTATDGGTGASRRVAAGSGRRTARRRARTRNRRPRRIRGHAPSAPERLGRRVEWVEVAGKTVDEATDRALDQLGVALSDAEVIVVSEPKTGLFGRMRVEARVRARVRPVGARPRRERSRRPARSGQGSRQDGSRQDGSRLGGQRSANGSGGSRSGASANGSGRGGGSNRAGSERANGATAARTGETGGGETGTGETGTGTSRSARRRRNRRNSVAGAASSVGVRGDGQPRRLGRGAREFEQRLHAGAGS